MRSDVAALVGWLVVAAVALAVDEVLIRRGSASLSAYIRRRPLVRALLVGAAATHFTR